MSKEPLFSIVIPTYNRAHIILNTLSYVFAQTYTNYEVIVVDNKSTDNIVEVLEPLVASGKVKFIQHDKNYERSKSRNTGMINAKGDVLSLLDSDDIIYPAFLEDAAKFIYENPSCHFFHNRHALVDEDGKEVYRFDFPTLSSDPEHLVYGNYLSCNGVFISKEVYSKFRYDEEPTLIGSEDYDFWLRIGAKYPSGRIDKYNSAMVQHSGRSISGVKPEEMLLQKDYVINKLKGDGECNKAFQPYFHKLEASFLIYTAVLCNLSNRHNESFKYLLAATKQDPIRTFTRRWIGAFVNGLLRR